ncbi:hypothetical protein [Streptacidiphilus rugosus]|uniref:hypothetical protein n=1 Tax=Streptacidiphilus rugosus TaxID=405783 RepID=UPI00055F456C|nr:hypothetical protein [Streptacidiphilus rugosus]
MTTPTTDVTGEALHTVDPFTTGSLTALTWFLRDRVRDAHAAGHPGAQQLQDSVEDAARGILTYVDQAARTPDPQAIAPARVRAHALWTGLETAASFWHDHPAHPAHARPADPRSAWRDPARYTTAR